MVGRDELEYPFGKAEYLNYDPEEIGSASDVVELLYWLGEVNRRNDNHLAAAVHDDAAEIVDRCLVGGESDGDGDE